MAGRIWVAGAAIAYGLVGLGMSVAGCADAQAREVRSAPLKEVNGRVVRVDQDKLLVALEIRGEVTLFRIDSSTVLFAPGRQIAVRDLAENLHVRAIYELGTERPYVLQCLEVAEGSGRSPGAPR